MNFGSRKRANSRNAAAHQTTKWPFYARATVFLLGLSALVTMLYIGRAIILPLVFAVIIANVLYPVVKLLVRRKLPRVVAIAITLFLAFVVIAALGVLLVSQATRLSRSLPTLVENFTGLLNQVVTWASGYLHINAQSIHDWLAKTLDAFVTTSSAAIGQTLVAAGSVVVVLLLVPVYVFLILFYQPLLLEFLRRLFAGSDQGQVNEIIAQTKNLVQRYLIGLLIEAAIMGTLNTVTLLVLGIDYAILLGIAGAMLNIIPFIGGILSVVFPMMVALATKSSAWYAVYVLLIYSATQLVDNYFLIPRIVASQVRINALFSILVVIAGNALWGMAGMFVAIPLLAIVKVIFDHIGPLKPWGFLLGDTMPRLLKIEPVLKLIRQRAPWRRGVASAGGSVLISPGRARSAAARAKS